MKAELINGIDYVDINKRKGKLYRLKNSNIIILCTKNSDDVLFEGTLIYTALFNGDLGNHTNQRTSKDYTEFKGEIKLTQ